MAKTTKKPGVRVNLLAQELGVESKDILAKIRAEGLDWAPNHMSTLTVGQAETVREWFAHSGGGTAVETAAPVDVATKPKVARAKKKKEDAVGIDEAPPTELPVDEAPVAEAPPVVAPEVHKPEIQPKKIVAPVEAAPVAPVTQPAPPVAPVEPPPALAPAATAAPVAPPAPPVARPVESPKQAVSRPTITLANRAAPQPVERAPQLLTPAAPVMRGPRVVREEKPEHVPAPRPRRPMGGGPSNEPPTFSPSRPQGGRGVKTADDETEESSDDKKKGAGAKGRTVSPRRKGLDGRRGEALAKLREFTDADLIARRDALNAASAARRTFDSHIRTAANRGTHVQSKTTVQKGEPVEIEEPITVKSLSATLGIKSNDIISKLIKSGVFATVNQALDKEAAATIALEYGLELRIKKQPTLEEQLLAEFDARDAESENLQPRPPVVTILGHVDHGKTSLLDKIRNANVAAGEAGGITQHTAAWMVEVGEGETKKRVTFIDTPGHQAFTAMRARGANMTDVVVLVVAAVEGVMPQTIESINHAKAAGVPIVVAMSKIDRNDANPDMVLGQLAANGLNPVEWGGDIEVVRTSTVTGQGIKELIEILDYQSELLELKSDPDAPARGSVIESRVDEGLGSVATVLVQEGTLKVGDIILSGPGYGRVRGLFNDRAQQIQSAGPSVPVIVSGLNLLPSAGDKFYVLDDMDRAKAIAEERETLARQKQLANKTQVTLDSIMESMKSAEVKEIKLIIKGDVQGSVETLAKTVTDQNTDEVRIRVIHSAVGAINESDVELADASGAVIIGFHVVPDEPARAMAEQRRVEIRLYRVIYEIFDDLKKALSGLLEPEIRQKLHGHAEIRAVYKHSRVGSIAGCYVTDGHIQRGSKIRLTRNGVIVTEDLAIESLKRLKDDVKEVKAGLECGIKLAGYDDIKEGDILEAYVRETIQRTL